MIQASRALLGQHSFFTVGAPEVIHCRPDGSDVADMRGNQARGWSIRKGATAVEAAGTIHSDFAKGFIKAEVIAYDDYCTYGGERGCKDAGRVRYEGINYVVQDGDVMLFRFR